MPAGSSTKAPEQPPHPSRSIKPELTSALKPYASKPTVPETRVKDPVLIMSETERKPARVQMRGLHDSLATSLLTPSVAKSATRDQGVDPMSTIYLDSSTEVDLASTKVTLGSKLKEPRT